MNPIFRNFDLSKNDSSGNRCLKLYICIIIFKLSWWLYKILRLDKLSDRYEKQNILQGDDDKYLSFQKWGVEISSVEYSVSVLFDFFNAEYFIAKRSWASDKHKRQSFFFFNSSLNWSINLRWLDDIQIL